MLLHDYETVMRYGANGWVRGADPALGGDVEHEQFHQSTHKDDDVRKQPDP